MSRIGNRELTVPEGVTVTNENGIITVKGPKGELSLELNPNIDVKIEDGIVKVTRNSEIKKTKQMHGTTNALINNMLIGVKEGYEKGLEIIGVGYRFNPKGKNLEINAGYSHKVELTVPEDLMKISAAAGLNGNRGKIWLDDFSLERIDNPNNNKEK